MTFAAASPRTRRFARRRSEIVDVASLHINLHGARGMTLTGVAKALGLDTSSVSYYFRRKDDLAAACFENTMQWSLDRAREAAAEASPQARVRHFLQSHFALFEQQRQDGASQLALLSDLRSLPADSRTAIDSLGAEAYRTVHGFFDPSIEGRARGYRLTATAHLFASIYWLPGWIDRYHIRDFPRVLDRLYDILAHGLGGSADWPVDTTPIDIADAPADAQSRFLRAAIRLINRLGYRGASVESIAAELGVSIGSFYHHLDNKDDLVVACFQRSFDLIARAQDRADQRGGNEAERLAIMASILVALQMSGESSLLRISAYQALPLDLRARMLALTGQVTRHVAGTIADGIAEGTLRPVDPMIASQTVMAAINAAADVRMPSRDTPEAVGQSATTYLHPLRHGIFAPLA